ncbi:MAG: ABC transporter permease [Clostridia bacterium]|nr:ABC transporter permease [Clostridia bacterium]
MFNNIWEGFKREVLLLFNDKRTLLMVFFVPILYTIFFGFLYSQGIVRELSTAVVNNSPCQLSRTIVDGFRSSERFAVNYELNSEDEILSLMEDKKIDVAIVIPSDFEANVKKGKPTEVFIGINAANMIIGNGAMVSAMQVVETYSSGVTLTKLKSQGLSSSQAYNGAIPLSFNFRPWYNPSYSYLNFMVLGILILAVQQITMMGAANSLVGEKEDENLSQFLTATNGSLLPFIIGKSAVYFISGLFSLVGSAFFAFEVFRIPLRGDFAHILLLTVPFLVCVIAWGLAIAVLCSDRAQATRIIMLLPYPIFLVSGLTYHLGAIPRPLQYLAMAIPFTHYGNYFRNVALMGLGLDQIWNSVNWLIMLALVYSLIFWAIFRFKWMGKRSLKREKMKKCCETF